LDDSRQNIASRHPHSAPRRPRAPILAPLDVGSMSSRSLSCHTIGSVKGRALVNGPFDHQVREGAGIDACIKRNCSSRTSPPRVAGYRSIAVGHDQDPLRHRRCHLSLSSTTPRAMGNTFVKCERRSWGSPVYRIIHINAIAVCSRAWSMKLIAKTHLRVGDNQVMAIACHRRYGSMGRGVERLGGKEEFRKRYKRNQKWATSRTAS